MQRYNSFNLIHKGLRALLYHTGLQLQQTDFTVENEAENAINRVKEVIMLFEGHAYKEDHFILPAIAVYEPSVVATFESEHEEDIQLGEKLNARVEKLENSQSLLEKIVAGRELTESFVSFMVFNLNHMAKEEDILNKILWRYYSDDEIKKITTDISKSVEPWIQDFYLTWMIRGINDSEARTWIKSVERNMPELVFQSLLQKAEQELSAGRFRKLTASLSEALQLV
ncbi:MAG: hemerythrin domain-containing protein [Flavisolibacter sp.]